MCVAESISYVLGTRTRCPRVQNGVFTYGRVCAMQSLQGKMSALIRTHSLLSLFFFLFLASILFACLSKVLRDTTSLDPRQEECVDAVISNGGAMLLLINDILVCCTVHPSPAHTVFRVSGCAKQANSSALHALTTVSSQLRLFWANGTPLSCMHPLYAVAWDENDVDCEAGKFSAARSTCNSV